MLCKKYVIILLKLCPVIYCISMLNYLLPKVNEFKSNNFKS